MFFIVMYCCYGIFCSHELKKELMLKYPTVRWLIEKRTTLLDEKNLFSLLRVYDQVVFLRRFHNRQVWSRPGIPSFPPPTLSNIELRPIPCVMKYWRLDLSFKKKKNHHCKKESSLHSAFYGKNHSVQCPPSVSILKSYQSFHDPQSEVRQRFY